MIAIDQLTDEQFERQALDLIKREFGATGWLDSFAFIAQAPAITREIEMLGKQA